MTIQNSTSASIESISLDSVLSEGASLNADTSFNKANVTGRERLAEKSIELTVAAQMGAALKQRMVWFGLTQKQEREYGFDAATNLGGTAFILQFKASSTVIKSGPYKGRRKFACQHQQMQALVSRFGSIPGSCFYLLPDVGLFSELQKISGDLIENSFLIDVSDLQDPIPPSGRKNDYHYVYLDAKTSKATMTSEPTQLNRIIRLSTFIDEMKAGLSARIPYSRDLIRAVNVDKVNQRLADEFFKNTALVVIAD